MLSDVKGMIFDVDGVLEFQGRVYPGAIETLDTLRERGIVLRILTNSTLKSRRSCAQKLREAGFQVFDKEVITASYATARYLEGLSPRSCWVLLEREGLDEFKDLNHDRENPEYIVIGDYQSKFNFENLNHALRLLRNGAKLIGMQSELVDNSMGEAELNVGSWTEMLARATREKATYVGKPNSYVFDLTLKTMGLEKRNVIMVGDMVSSDIVGAKSCGIRSVLLKTGEFNERDLDGDIEPDFVFDSIEDMLSVI